MDQPVFMHWIAVSHADARKFPKKRGLPTSDNYGEKENEGPYDEQEQTNARLKVFSRRTGVRK